MAIENDPSARMQFAGMGELVHPGSCMVCGSGNCEEGYVRLGVYFEYEGEMYLCRTCLVQASELIGCVTPEEAVLIHKNAAEYKDLWENADAELEKANERLAAYDRVLATIDPIIYGTGSDPDDSPSENDHEAVEAAADPKPEPAEPVTQPRRGNPKKSASADRSNAVSI